MIHIVIHAKKFFTVLKITASVLIIWFVTHSVWIIMDGIRDTGKKADLAVILGSKVNEDELYRKGLRNGLKPEFSFIKLTESTRSSSAAAWEKKDFMKVLK